MTKLNNFEYDESVFGLSAIMVSALRSIPKCPNCHRYMPSVYEARDGKLMCERCFHVLPDYYGTAFEKAK
jgi:hypothetical protein